MTELLQKKDHADAPDMGSDRSFGLVFTAVFAILAGVFYYNGHDDYTIPAAAASGVFLVVALIIPSALRPLNLIWFKFGMLLHKIISPLVLGMLFFVTVTPIALIMRALGKDPLNLRLDAEAKSYWVHRDPPGPAAESMSDQF